MKKNKWYENLNQKELRTTQIQKDNQDDITVGAYLGLVIFFIIGVVYLILR